MRWLHVSTRRVLRLAQRCDGDSDFYVYILHLYSRGEDVRMKYKIRLVLFGDAVETLVRRNHSIWLVKAGKAMQAFTKVFCSILVQQYNQKAKSCILLCDGYDRSSSPCA
jgi:hypothetical protein